jgi:hypothetical protein
LRMKTAIMAIAQAMPKISPQNALFCSGAIVPALPYSSGLFLVSDSIHIVYYTIHLVNMLLHKDTS